MTTCTVVVASYPERRLCGKPGVTTFTSRITEEKFHECAAHAIARVTPAARTRTGSFTAFGKAFRTATRRPYVLVMGPEAAFVGRLSGTLHPATEPFVFGYAETIDTARKRARATERARGTKVAVVATATGETVCFGGLVG